MPAQRISPFLLKEVPHHTYQRGLRNATPPLHPSLSQCFAIVQPGLPWPVLEAMQTPLSHHPAAAFLPHAPSGALHRIMHLAMTRGLARSRAQHGVARFTTALQLVGDQCTVAGPSVARSTMIQQLMRD